jgi:hypothetical protein
LYDGKLWYEGEWKNGQLHGQGKMYHDNGELKYEGEWKDGKPDKQKKVEPPFIPVTTVRGYVVSFDTLLT